MSQTPFRGVALLLIVLLSGCASGHRSPAGGESETHPGQQGYALLFDLMGDEQNVSKLLIIKRERMEFGKLIKEISRRTAAAHKQLEAFAKTDRSLNLKERGLPAAEVNTRQSISKTRGKELLTDKGKDFEVQLLLTQNEALTYGAHLAAVTAKTEMSADRGNFLRTLSADLTQLQQRVVAMLMANYSWSLKS